MDVQEAIIQDMQPTPIQSFYKDTHILVTGSTGFLGRLLLEKLLRSCPDISTIYILVRNKKGKNLASRVDELFEDVIFEELKKVNPKFKHKVVPIEGDCSLPELGISEQDQQMLVKKLNIVFHSAATVRFDEKLNLAVPINVKAPLYLVNLAKQMKNLKCFMHISTAYTNCTQPLIEEKVYPPPMDHEELIKVTDNVSEKLLCNLTEQIVGKWPNTYAFTKAVAETVVAKEGKGLPAVIFRPSIIISTYKEPIPAWINNIYGPTGIAAAAGLGILRTLHCDETVNGNMIPVDMCVNAVMATAWEIGTKFEKKKAQAAEQEVPVYHYESSNDQPITWGHFMELNSTYGCQYATTKAMWVYSLTLMKHKFLYNILKFFLHIIPALIVDMVCLAIGKQAMLLKIYKKVHKFSEVLSYFTTRNFRFQSNNVNNMLTHMTARDKEIFFCDLKELDWDAFFQIYMRGVRVYLIQDDLSTLPRAKVLWNRYLFFHRAIKVIFGLLFLRILWMVMPYFF